MILGFETLALSFRELKFMRADEKSTLLRKKTRGKTGFGAPNQGVDDRFSYWAHCRAVAPPTHPCGPAELGAKDGQWHSPMDVHFVCGIFQRIATSPEDFHGNVQSHVPTDVHSCRFWCAISCPDEHPLAARGWFADLSIVGQREVRQLAAHAGLGGRQRGLLPGMR